MFDTITNILNNKNTVTLSIYTKNSYDDLWNHYGFVHYVISIVLGCAPIYKWDPRITAHSTIYVKKM